MKSLRKLLLILLTASLAGCASAGSGTVSSAEGENPSAIDQKVNQLERQQKSNFRVQNYVERGL